MGARFVAAGSSIQNSHKRAILSLYVPSLFFGVPGHAAFLLLPLCIIEIGGSPSAAAAVIGFKGLGMMLFDIPGGKIAGKIGNKLTMQLAAMLVGLTFLAYSFCDSVILFWIVAFIHGCGSSTFLVGRMSFLASNYPVNQRGRIIAMIAGSLRLTALLGPLVGGMLVEIIDFRNTFLLSSACFFIGVLCMYRSRVMENVGEVGIRSDGTLDILRDYRKVFMTAGVAAVVFMLMRAARTVLIPIIGENYNLDPSTIGFIVSVSALVDVLLFYPAGMAMDKYGRRFTAVPSSILFTIGLLGMATATSFLPLLFWSILLGIANGLSTGIVMTLGTDHAPIGRRGEFLGVWRLITDTGSTLGPLVVSGLLVFWPLSIAALSIGMFCGIGTFLIYSNVDETVKDS
ncbi:MAG: MFS transporter [Pseudomonadota bacterium]|nr:MFS transporter [Pseudomonadota bacterium]